MPNQDLRELNRQTLIGCTAERGDAWHKRTDLMDGEDNHYEGFIPVGDIKRRLFGWEPRQAQVAYLVPATGYDDPAEVVTVNGQAFRVVPTQSDRVGILRGDNDYDMGVFKDGVVHPPYSITLIREAERLTGTTLGISTAGLLNKGARAWVEFSMEETLHDDKSGYSFRPNLLKADSMDGSIAMTTALTIEATVCMNTLRWNLAEAAEAGRIFRRKHTSGVAVGDLQDERDALGILERTSETFTEGMHALLEREMNPKQRIEVMDIIVPMPDDASDRSRTMASNRRDALWAMDKNPMVEPWIGTAWGEFQRYNTFDHWETTVKGTGRWERNTWRAINGKRADADGRIITALAKVLA